MVGVGGSALQEHGGDPDVDERAMSSEWHKQQNRTTFTAIALENNRENFTIRQNKSDVAVISNMKLKKRCHTSVLDEGF